MKHRLVQNCLITLEGTSLHYDARTCTATIWGDFKLDLGFGLGTAMKLKLGDVMSILEKTDVTRFKGIPARALIEDNVTIDIGHYMKNKWYYCRQLPEEEYKDMLTSYKPGDFELVKLVYGTQAAKACDEQQLKESADEIRQIIKDNSTKRRKKVIK